MLPASYGQRHQGRLASTVLWIGVLNTLFVDAVCSSRVTATSTVTPSKMALKGTSTGDDPLQNSRLHLRHPEEPRTTRKRDDKLAHGQRSLLMCRIYIQTAWSLIG